MHNFKQKNPLIAKKGQFEEQQFEVKIVNREYNAERTISSI